MAKAISVAVGFSIFVPRSDSIYTLFIDRVDQVGDEWYTFAAMRKTNSGGLRDEVVVRTTTQPTWQPADQVRIYLQCTGGYEIQGDATTKLPCFDYLFTD